MRKWLSYPGLPDTFRLGFKFKGKKKITIPMLSHMLFNKRNFNPAMQVHPVVPCKSTFERLENPCIAFTSKVGQNTLTMSSRTGETFGCILRVSLAIPYCAPFFFVRTSIFIVLSVKNLSVATSGYVVQYCSLYGGVCYVEVVYYRGYPLYRQFGFIS